jgi:hypothetical protein
VSNLDPRKYTLSLIGIKLAVIGFRRIAADMNNHDSYRLSTLFARPTGNAHVIFASVVIDEPSERLAY